MDTQAKKDEFVRLFTRNERRVYAYILSLVPSWQDADEIAQETNVRLWQAFDSFEPGTNFAAWAMRIAHYQVLTWRKRTARSKLVFNPELLDLVAEEHLRLEGLSDIRHQALAACVEELDASNRDLLSQCYAEGAEVRAIAIRLKKNIASVYKRLQRIRLALHKCITRRLEAEGAVR